MVSSSPLYTHCKLKCMSQAGCSHGSDGGPWAGGERRSEAVQGSPSSGCGFTSLGLGCSASPRCSHALAAPSCHQICQQDCLWVAFHDMRELILLRKIFIFYFVLCFFGFFFLNGVGSLLWQTQSPHKTVVLAQRIGLGTSGWWGMRVLEHRDNVCALSWAQCQRAGEGPPWALQPIGTFYYWAVIKKGTIVSKIFEVHSTRLGCICKARGISPADPGWAREARLNRLKTTL